MLFLFLFLLLVLVVCAFFAFGRKYIYIMNTMTTMMISRRCVVSAFLVFFSRIRFASSRRTRTLLHQSEKHFDKKERILVIWGGAFNKRRDFETTRFSFSFLLRTQEEGKKDTFETKRIISSSSEESARFERTQTHTRAHKTREREREKDDAFFFFSDIVVCLFCVRIICEDHREREREKTFYHLASDKRERENIEIIKERRRH